MYKELHKTNEFVINSEFSDECCLKVYPHNRAHKRTQPQRPDLPVLYNIFHSIINTTLEINGYVSRYELNMELIRASSGYVCSG